MKLLYIAEIVAQCGIWSLKNCLPRLKLLYKADYIIANANSASGAGGLSRQHAGYLRKLGVKCLTLGDNAFIIPQIFENNVLNYCIRPFNLSVQAPGIGYKAFYGNTAKTAAGAADRNTEAPKLVVLSLLGQYGRHRISANAPLDAVDFIVRKFPDSAIFIDYASFSTGEKQILKYYADGKVSALIGSGSKVATADAQISENGTAYITDAGRSGASLSAGGYEAENKIREFKTGLTEYAACSWDDAQVQGIFLEIDEHNKALRIERIREKCRSDAIKD